MKVQLYRTGDYKSFDDAEASGACYAFSVKDDADVDSIKNAIYETAWMFGYDSDDVDVRIVY